MTTEREALDLIRATATCSMPRCINLEAIDRILADVPAAPAVASLPLDAIEALQATPAPLATSKYLAPALDYLRKCVGRDGGAEFSADEAAALLAAVDQAQPAPLADAELQQLADLEATATPGPWLYKPEWLDWVIGVQDTRPGYTDDLLRIAERASHQAADRTQANFRLIAALRNALPGLLARVGAAETKVASYQPAPLPTGWVPFGESKEEPEEGIRCEVELVGEQAEQPLYATYWAGREGDFATWVDHSGKWYYANQVRRYRYAPAAPESGKEPSNG